VLGLGLFLVLYSGLVAWFGWTTTRLFRVAFAGDGDIFAGVAAVGAAFLVLVLVKGVFFDA
jgi:hypothetical protein